MISSPRTVNLPITRDAFETLASQTCQPRVDADRVMLSVNAEASDFIRFNHALVRQATVVSQCSATITVVNGKKRNNSRVSLGADPSANAQRLKMECERLCAELQMIPDDPHLLLPDVVINSVREDDRGGLPARDELIQTACRSAQGTDMVGFYAGGPMISAFADSRGQRNWHHVSSFHFDWSLYLDIPDATDRAVKTVYAGQQWDRAAFVQRMQQAREQLGPLSKPPITIKPGSYRAYLAAAPTADLLAGLAWSGFSRKERETGTSSLVKLASGEQSMSPMVHIAETTHAGTAPTFTSTGLVRPQQVELVRAGKAADNMVSLRSAAEFSETANSDNDEYPQSLAMTGGQLAASAALAALDTGLWISNLWYLNYSDRPACRMTGMTRFATFWVENGKIIAPIKVMRFDDSLIRLFGESLEALTREVEFMPDASTWGARHMSSFSAPGALLKEMRFTL